MLEKILAEKIHSSGPINFSEFMNLALYKKDLGYYLKNHIGETGDFITSPHVHPLFGSLIGKQIIQIWELMDRPDPFYIFEFGGAPGTLSQDLINYCSKINPTFLKQMKYIIIDPGPVTKKNVLHINSVKELKEISKVGCIISNELIDSLPTRRFQKTTDSFKEIFIDLIEEKFQFKLLEIADKKILTILLNNYENIPTGSKIEFNENLCELANDFYKILDQGFVITIDYGFNSPNIQNNKILYNSFRCYYNHNSDQNPLTNIGGKDMTYDIDFNLWNKNLTSVGFNYYRSIDQSDFLLNLGFKKFLDQIRESDLPENQKNLNRKAMLDLIKPNGLGRFTVQSHSKKIEKEIYLDGFSIK
ncbi:MAG: SAM-dependent methyltransferase [Dehalococcoidia bacterium]|jgi:SAM-dependent MidA family methyltransferase|nr:SAM-dependent methyltransferase [Dehalococcoidia bacterium]HJN58553.1 SAM-dependent methyltransferase [Dehalococcoidia bacterium]